jgi:hypothetical protein
VHCTDGQPGFVANASWRHALIAVIENNETSYNNALMKNLLAVLALVSLLAVLSACGGGSNYPVVPQSVAPTITTQPQSQTVTAGHTATFSVVASGTTPLTYQWMKNTVAIGGATATSYTTPATATTDSGSSFTVTVTNTKGNVTSNAAILTVNAASLTPQTITFANPGTQTVGTPLTLSATATSGLPVAFASTTTSICTVSGTTASFIAAGSCTIQATQAGNTTYAAATPVSRSFTVNADTIPLAPTDLTATAGNAFVSLSWTASTGATSYDVYRGTTSNGESTTAIATGITTAAYTDNSVTNGTTYYYKVAAVNGAGTSGLSNEASAKPEATIPSACGGMSTGVNTSLNGYVPFPPTYAWNTDISSAPLDPNNDTITSAAGFAGLHLHHDFSSVAGGNYGIPYMVVDSTSTPLVPIDVVSYPDESDVAYAPFPPNAPIEGDPPACTGGPNNYQGDQHVLVLDRNRCMLYETFNSVYCSGAWSSDSETIWDMQSSEQRPWGWTSADAAGLAIFPGLVRYDEVAAGAINHAIRFTMQHTKNDANGGYFVEPASHAAGNIWGVDNVMGMRIRLKSSFDISGYSVDNQVILTAMKKYGMILADNGGYFFFQGVPDPRWDDNDLIDLDSIQSSNFEVVQMTPEFPGWDSATAPTGAPPTINSFTASALTVTSGTPVTLQWSASNDSYDFIDKLGGVHGGSVTITPTATTTFTLNATNQYGRSTRQLTITVH